MLTAEANNPHCLNVTWRKAADPVTGYKIHCFPGDSWKAEIVKEIEDVNKESTVISGLKPETEYRMGITSVCSGSQSKMVFSGQEVKLRKSVINLLLIFQYAKTPIFKMIDEIKLNFLSLFSAGIHHLVLEQNLLILRKNLIIGNRIRRLWEKGSSKKQYASITEKKEDRIQRFSEWLKWRPLEDYRRFIKLLEKTKQEALASALVASCKIYFN